jgi:hypothetical protein
MDDCCNNHTDGATCCSGAEVKLESTHACACGHNKAEAAVAEVRN